MAQDQEDQTALRTAPRNTYCIVSSSTIECIQSIIGLVPRVIPTEANKEHVYSIVEF